MASKKALLDADVVTLGRPALRRPAAFPARLAEEKPCVAVRLEERRHAVCVVVVRVREHGHVNGAQVDAKQCSVVGKGVRLAEVEREVGRFPRALIAEMERQTIAGTKRTAQERNRALRRMIQGITK
jgi:hypothetical protein